MRFGSYGRECGSGGVEIKDTRRDVAKHVGREWGRRNKWNKRRKETDFFCACHCRYSPVLITALFWECHLHRDRRGGILVRLSPRFDRTNLSVEEKHLSHWWVWELNSFPPTPAPNLIFNFGAQTAAINDCTGMSFEVTYHILKCDQSFSVP